VCKRQTEPFSTSCGKGALEYLLLKTDLSGRAKQRALSLGLDPASQTRGAGEKMGGVKKRSPSVGVPVLRKFVHTSLKGFLPTDWLYYELTLGGGVSDGSSERTRCLSSHHRQMLKMAH